MQACARWNTNREQCCQTGPPRRSGAATGVTTEGATRKDGICQHQRIRSTCKECGGAGICLPAPAYKEHMQGVRGRKHLPAPATEEPLQGVRGHEHLPAPSSKEPLQGVRGREHLPAPTQQERMHGVRGGEHLPASAHQEQVQ